ncbi:MaoC/PaaZ C-terminal domain-containing protein [Planococcus shenhongbingii]|uniref:MaoC/PaaZ C-terminal domain-containing protein n=1 Tax=Planococcus shenhongbingii TaxID=3058398 RepID=A0ABT8NDJ3_9BACL|nr:MULTISPECIES: MaoC/PaaZ C-terminal domain-containing protein [unclassified Planococcus (in: firmicutes)]MDN7245966.1 MaoC/PaaZ C-terminal domain-containing protein [Planococcus sp. N017]WKA59902.1 MaoC/PaaZ C-terminal domain-containing protein [Planococcus sp. N016]
MLLGKKRKLGRKVEAMNVGEKLKLTEKIEDKDLLLYLGLTNDGNPLYIQHDFASQTVFEKPVVPNIMLTGIITSAISKYLPGPGSYINEQRLKFKQPVFHYSTIEFLLEVTDVDVKDNEVTIRIEATNEEGNLVVEGTVLVNPPQIINQLTTQAMDNF